MPSSMNSLSCSCSPRFSAAPISRTSCRSSRLSMTCTLRVRSPSMRPSLEGTTRHLATRSNVSRRPGQVLQPQTMLHQSQTQLPRAQPELTGQVVVQLWTTRGRQLQPLPMRVVAVLDEQITVGQTVRLAVRTTRSRVIGAHRPTHRVRDLFDLLRDLLDLVGHAIQTALVHVPCLQTRKDLFLVYLRQPHNFGHVRYLFNRGSDDRDHQGADVPHLEHGIPEERGTHVDARAVFSLQPA